MLWLLSGLGADQRLYGKLTLPPHHRHGHWPDFTGCHTMAQFADRAIELGVSQGDHLVGSSFGGFVALEISQRVQLGGLLLLGSAYQQREINRLSLIGGRWLRSFSGHDAQTVLRPFSKRGPKSLELSMFINSDVQVMQGMFEAILSWTGSSAACRCRRIHGKLDPIIPWRSHLRYDVSAWCTHLVALEQPQHCQQQLEWLLNHNHNDNK